jgi:galactofuranosylgalactofuranosylrhamnosyl-N-acetylglucosaminyl-diphospho-decaprenol beta-1,5/1,6-galactofuranosyltransferase
MHLLQSSLLPAPGQPASLYLRLQTERGPGGLRQGAAAGEGLGLGLQAGETLSTDTLFGSFYTSTWRALTDLEDLFVVIAFRGRGELRVFEDDGGAAGPVLLCRHGLDSATMQRFLIPVSPSGLAGEDRASRLFVEVEALQAAEVDAIDIMTTRPPRRAVSLSVGLSTHNDAASRIGPLLDALRRLERSEPGLIKAIYLVNHGPDLGATTQGLRGLHLLPPAGLDAPGGLAQTVAAARGAADAASHHLVLADDLVLDERLIPRAVQLLRHSRGEVLLGGAILDAQAPTTLVGAGGVITASGAVGQFGADQDMADVEALALFNRPVAVDLPCWWYCLLPLSASSHSPLPSGPWLRGDDAAYASDQEARGIALACLPGLGAWRGAALTLPEGGGAEVDLANRYLPPHLPQATSDWAEARRGGLHVLQSTFFPTEGLPEALYLSITPPRPNGGLTPRPTASGAPALRLDTGDILSTDTWFGNFYRAYWHEHAGLGALAVAVGLRGAAKVSVIEDHGTSVSILAERQLSSPTAQRFLIDVVPADLTRTAAEALAKASRLYVTIEAEAACDVLAIDFVSSQAPRRRASLSIGLCTFNQEAYFARTLDRVARLAAQTPSIRAVHVVNQGASFQSPAIRALLDAPKLHLVEQRNLGGCGGFTRSLAEELAAPEPASHHLMMDDDIVLDERMILRAVRFLDYANHDVALGAGMLDSMRPTVMYEAGAFLRSDNTIHPYCHDVDLSEPENLIYFDRPVTTDYNAWWFCILPVERARGLGLPAPVFIRGDDFEYGQRLARAGVPTVTLPALGVWHEPFYAKPTGWQNYYDLRNRLIFAATYRERVRQLSLTHVLGLITRAILSHNYMAAELRLRAVQDFLRGPDALFATDPEVLHGGIMALARQDAPERLEDGWKLVALAATKPMPEGMWRLVALMLRLMLRTGLGPLNRGAAGVLIDAEAAPINTAGRAYVLTNDPRSFHLRFVPRRGRMWGLMARAALLAWRYRARRQAAGADWARGIDAYREQAWWARVFAQPAAQIAGETRGRTPARDTPDATGTPDRATPTTDRATGHD